MTVRTGAELPAAGTGALGASDTWVGGAEEFALTDGEGETTAFMVVVEPDDPEPPASAGGAPGSVAVAVVVGRVVVVAPVVGAAPFTA